MSALFTARGISPTDEQLAIQTAAEPTIVIEANAGAAKTTTLALRMAQAWQQGVAPAQIHALTYTDPACDAMRAALKLLGVPFEVARRFRISTFEAFAAAVLLKLEGAPVSALATPELHKPWVLQALQQVENNPDERWPDELAFPATGDATVEAFLAECRLLKGSMLLDLQAPQSRITPTVAGDLGRSYALLKTFRAFETLRRGGHPDRPRFRGPFDATYDLARLFWRDEFPPDAPGWPAALRLLVVDEMHDMNQAMFVILARLLNSHRRAMFCGAGDRDQVIHKIAGADARFMHDALQAATGRTVQRYPLTASYRFGRTLSAMASRVANKPYASACEHETRVVVLGYDSGAQCASLIVEQAAQWQARFGSRQMAQFVVLLRHGHQSVRLENALLEAGIAYVTRGFDSYLLRPEILLVRGLLAVATDDLSSVEDPDTRRRILEAFIVFGEIRITVGHDDEQDQAVLRRQAVQAVVENPRILSAFFENQVLRNAAPPVRDRLLAAVDTARSAPGPDLLGRVLEVLQVPVLAARVLVEQQRLRDVNHNIAGLRASAAAFTDAAAFFASLNGAELRQRKLKRSDSLLLASVESVKGLEFDHVLLPYLSRHTFPDADCAPDEERNLFYVGITRARKFLTLCADRAQPSRFIADAGAKLTAG